MRQQQLDFAEGFRVACTVREGISAARAGHGAPDATSPACAGLVLLRMGKLSAR